MRRFMLTVIVIIAVIPWMDPPSAKRSPVLLSLRAALDASELSALIPASALLAIQFSDLDRRWDEIRSTPALAAFQDSVLACAGMQPEIVPLLAGDQAVVFFAPLERQPFLLPVAILRPTDMGRAEDVLSSLGKLAHARARGALWLGPAGSEGALEELVRAEGAGLGAVLPLQEIEERLPQGGLIRGWVNPAAWVKLLRNCRDRISVPLYQWAASAAAAELAAVRYIAFRRDLANGELTVDGMIVYDLSRLPPEVLQIFNPDASPAFLPAELPPNTLALAAFRPEAQAWLPWIRYLAAADSQGPLRNTSFWIDEFEQRYRRNLDRDFFPAFGERAWVMASLAKDAGSVDLTWIFEIRKASALDSTLSDLASWLGEQIRLRTFGALAAKSRSLALRGSVVHGLALRTPFSNIPGPYLQIAGGYLIIAGTDATLQSGRALAEKIRQSDAGAVTASRGLPNHGSILLQGAQFAMLIRAAKQADEHYFCFLDAVAGMAVGLESSRMDFRYEYDAVRFQDRIRFAVPRERSSGPERTEVPIHRYCQERRAY